MVEFIRIFNRALPEGKIELIFREVVIEDLDSLVFEWTKDYVAYRDEDVLVIVGKRTTPQTTP